MHSLPSLAGGDGAYTLIRTDSTCHPAQLTERIRQRLWGLSEELCRHERKRSLCLGLREAGPPRSTAACWSATRGLRPLERRSALGNRGAARPPRPGPPGSAAAVERADRRGGRERGWPPPAAASSRGAVLQGGTQRRGRRAAPPALP